MAILKPTKLPVIFGAGAAALLALGSGVPAMAQYSQELRHDPARCNSGSAVWVNITGIKQGGGTMRVQSYRATKEDWLQSGRWLNRIELPARGGSMRVCMPLPAAGHYGIAVRHDVNNNGKTDLSTDGGAMSNNPSINIWNLGKPSYKKVGFDVGRTPASISITMRYR